MKTAPLLSIGMIFKNEARCLERCLQSLEPLRQAIPCELVMADTGATDGSRAIAEQYADTVFDFAWIDDFAAARNAVMDRCTGKWYLTIDCDEWLDSDFSELLAFLRSGKKVDLGFVVQRNYASLEMEQSDSYNDFHALRLVRMSSGQRYTGTIHESWAYREPAERLTRTILHHDGYFFVDPEAAKRKKQRNMALLRKELKKHPDDPRVLVECIESGNDDADFIQYVRRAVELVQRRNGAEGEYGPAILRHAADIAYRYKMSELEEWCRLAEERYPNSLFVQVDLNYSAFLAAYDQKKWELAVHYGEAYQKGLQVLRARHLPKNVKDERNRGTIRSGDPYSERILLIGLADAYCQNKQGKKALQILAGLDSVMFDAKHVRNYVVSLCQLHAQTMQDAAPVLTTFYGQIRREEPNKQKQQVRLAAFDSMAAVCFTKKYQEEEKEHEGYWRPAYTAFSALADKCEAGRAAAILMSSDPAEIHSLLAQVEDWQALPIEALEYALKAGVTFPLEEKTLPSEVLDGLAAKLTGGENYAKQIVLALPENEEYSSLQSLFWMQSLAMAALRSFDWSLGANDTPVSEFARPDKKQGENKKPECTPEEGLALIRRFAQIESTALPLLYTPQALAEDNAALLPPMHRWGLYCSLALNALDSGNSQEYLALLRKGLAACPGQKEIVQFLLDRFREDTRPKASPELLALAEKVRMILSAYDPADSAVTALKASPAYQQVAWIIEEPNDGGMPS